VCSNLPWHLLVALHLCPFGRLPTSIQFFDIQALEWAILFHPPEARLKPIARSPHGYLGVNVQVASQVDGREEEVSDFVQGGASTVRLGEFL